MLEKQDLALTQRIFNFYTKLCFIPYEFSDNCTKINSTSQHRSRIWKIVCGLVLAMAIFKDIRLVQSFLNPDLFRLDHMMIHVAHILFLHTGLAVSWTVYKWHVETITIYNESFGILQGMNLRCKFNFSHLKKKLLTSKMVDILVMVVVPSFIAASLNAMGMFIQDPVRAELFFSVLDAENRTMPVLCACLAVEIWVQNFAFCNTGFAAMIQLGFFRKCLLVADECEKDIHDEGTTKRIRKLHMLVHLFNVSQSLLPYVSKLFCIVVAVGSLFVGIHLLGRDNFVSAFGISTGSYAVIGFIVVFDQAFKIPTAAGRLSIAVSTSKSIMKIETVENDVCMQDMEGIDSEVEKGCHQATKTNVIMTDRKSNGEFLKKFLKSMPRLAIKVSSFTTLERDSTTDFLAFVSQQVFSLLIAFN